MRILLVDGGVGWWFLPVGMEKIWLNYLNFPPFSFFFFFCFKNQLDCEIWLQKKSQHFMWPYFTQLPVKLWVCQIMKQGRHSGADLSLLFLFHHGLFFDLPFPCNFKLLPEVFCKWLRVMGTGRPCACPVNFNLPFIWVIFHMKI